MSFTPPEIRTALGCAVLGEFSYVSNKALLTRKGECNRRHPAFLLLPLPLALVPSGHP